MNRKILFKAKAINRDKGYHRSNYKNGDWVYGLITRLYDERFENLPAEMTDENGVSGIEIDHNTICQCTGLTDKSGNKIWENDVVEEDWGKYKGIIRFGMFENQSLKNLGFNVDWIKYKYYRQDLLYWVDRLEVKGNIFDNPELLESRCEDG